MSFQEAYKACNLCHQYSEELAEFTSRRRSNIAQIVLRTLRDSMTFKAMGELRKDKTRKSRVKHADEYLAICAKCDYDSPRIAEILECKVRTTLREHSKRKLKESGIIS